MLREGGEGGRVGERGREEGGKIERGNPDNEKEDRDREEEGGRER